jgi:hypothetical protein
MKQTHSRDGNIWYHLHTDGRLGPVVSKSLRVEPQGCELSGLD